MQGIQHRAVRLVAQRLEISPGETRTRMRGVDGFSTDLRHAHTVSGTRHGQFGIHGITLAIGVFFIQKRRGNSIRQTVYRPLQRIIFHFEVKRCAIRRGAGVVAATVHFQEFRQAIRLRILFRPHQRHVFKIVRQPWMGVRIFQRPHRHNQRRERFHRLRIGNQQHGHSVIKANSLILAGIFFALTDSFLNRLPTGICLSDGSPKGDKQNKRFEQGAAWHYDLFITATSLTKCVLDVPASLSFGTSVRDKGCIINERPNLCNFYTALRTD